MSKVLIVILRTFDKKKRFNMMKKTKSGRRRPMDCPFCDAYLPNEVETCPCCSQELSFVCPVCHHFHSILEDCIRPRPALFAKFQSIYGHRVWRWTLISSLLYLPLLGSLLVLSELRPYFWKILVAEIFCFMVTYQTIKTIFFRRFERNMRPCSIRQNDPWNRH